MEIALVSPARVLCVRLRRPVRSSGEARVSGSAARNPYDGGNKPCASSEPHEPHTWTLAAIDGNYYDCPGVPEPPASTTFVVTTVETATTQYTVSAASYDEAREKVERGEYDGWRDLGHDDMEVIDVKVVEA